MITDETGVSFIKRHEGKHDGNKATAILEPQKDPIGLYTLGYGARYDKKGKPVTKDTPAITEEEATELLKRDLKIAEAAVSKYVKVPLTQNQFNALVSFTYNCGSGTLQKSALCAKINARSTISEADFTPYSKARQNGVLVVLPGLLKRRKEEALLFITGKN